MAVLEPEPSRIAEYANSRLGDAGRVDRASLRDMANRDVDVRQVSSGSRTQTEQLKHDIIDTADTQADLISANVWRTEVDRDSGRIAVTMEKITSPAAHRLKELYGKKVELVEEPNIQATNLVGRQADGSPFSGGARVFMEKGGGCSTAFAWSIGSANGLLTAGHCAPAGDLFSTNAMQVGYVTSGSRENYTNGAGTGRLSGQTALYGDMALIQVWDGRFSIGRIYRGAPNSTTSHSVRSMWHRRAAAGDQFCTGGATAGEICGWTVEKTGADVKTNQGINHNQVTSKAKQGGCTRPGDSGGPVYTVNADGSVAAKGIVSSGSGGGTDYFGGLFDQCRMQFTDIYDAYAGFPGILKTQ